MRSRSLILPLAVALTTASAASAQSAPPATISVTGEATKSVTPDIAHIDAGVVTEAKTAREASDTNNAAMGKILLAIKSAGIDESDYQTTRLSLQAEYAQNRTAPNAITGYRASNRITLKLRDVAKAPQMIDMLVGAGANDIGGIGFSVSNPSKLLDEAREQAVADARRKAEIYAKATGVRLGAPLTIVEDGAAVPVQYRRMMASAAAPPPPVAAGEETLRMTVNISWEIKPLPPSEPPPPIPPAPIPNPSPKAE